MTFEKEMNIGQKMKSIRKAKGMSQKFVAEKLDLKIQTYSNYEAGRRTPKYKVVSDFCKLLQIPVEEIIIEED